MHSRLNLGLIAPPIEGESGYGFLCRNAYLNGFGSAVEIQEYSIPEQRLMDAVGRRRFEYAALYKLARQVSNWTPGLVAANLSNYALHGFFSYWNPAMYAISCGDYLSEKFDAGVPGYIDRSAEYSSLAHWWEPLGVSRKTHCYCEECVIEQMETYGFATWMLIHNVGQVKVCPLHGKWLTKVRPGVILLPGLRGSTKGIEKPTGKIPDIEIHYAKMVGFFLDNPLPKGSKDKLNKIIERHKTQLYSIGINPNRLDVLVLFASFVSRSLAKKLMSRKKMDLSKDLKDIANLIENAADFRREYSAMIEVIGGTRDEEALWEQWLSIYDAGRNHVLDLRS